MSATAAAAADDQLSLKGSCHCGAVRFEVDNANLNQATKCNCTICNASGTISIMVADGNLKLITKDGTTQSINHKNSREGLVPELAAYSFSPPGEEKHQVYHHFCAKCGIHCFLTGYLDFMGGAFNCANLRTLNLKEHGKDIRDYTSPGKVQYCDGLADTWAMQKDTPFPGGAW